MTELSGYRLEMLWEGGEIALYRGKREGLAQILVATPLMEQPSIGSLRRLEQEYLLRGELDGSWAARPVGLAQHRNQLALVLEDPGGEPLDRLLLDGPLGVAPFLHLAISITAAVRSMHERGLIHKDVKPAHILVDGKGGAWLTGFGIATRLPRERQAPEPPEVIAGTLAYMAPEQTGRMNRSVDSRSDLYALGVTFYQMLTGTLPFTASDPMAWVHCHIARRPVPPSERVTTVPKQISLIVMKLLAKTAEERYQTAAGVANDLQRCLAEWKAHRAIAPFPLGADDASDRLMIPEKLYGRETEIAILLASFDRVIRQGMTELVLVSGYSGVGKSSLVNELQRELVPPRGLFAAGKFDQYKQNIPYATIAQAFQSLVQQILGKSDAELNQWRDRLLEAVGPNGELMANLVPELALVIGEQPPAPELRPQDQQARFQLVLRRFLAVFARPGHPLALFLDDLQWLDSATLDLIEHLVLHPEVRHLLLVGAYRDNEIDRKHPLARMLARVRKGGGRLQEILLAPLSPHDTEQLLADALHMETSSVRQLADLVFERTAGNPFFTIQFLGALSEEGSLAFHRGTGAWRWDLPRMRAKGFTDNVADLMAAKLSYLPSAARTILGHLACIGNTAEAATLALVEEKTEESVRELLVHATRAGRVRQHENAYGFLHDRIHEAAYALVPEIERATVHLRIGRLLAKGTAPAELEEKIFDIVNQFDRSAALITADREREQIAALYLLAGKRAKASTAYTSAMRYLSVGAALLKDNSWERQHECRFALELCRAECEFLTGQSAAAEARLTVLSAHAANTVERATATCVAADLYTTLSRSDRAVAACLDYLRHLGIEWSAHPTQAEAQREYDRVWAQLGSRPIKQLIDAPLMRDPESLATLDVLTKMLPPALFTDANLLSLAICRAVNLSIERGNSDSSCVAYAWLGQVAGLHFGSYKAGFRFGWLGCELVERRGLKRFEARTSMVFASHVIPWTKHVRAGRALIRQGFEASSKIGDLCYAAYSWSNLTANLLAAGDPLLEVQHEAEKSLSFAQQARFGLVIDHIIPKLVFIQTLRGLTPRFGYFDDDQFEERQFECHLASDPALVQAECFYWIRKLQARFLAGEYASGLDASMKAQRLLWAAPSNLEAVDYHLYGALCRAAACDSAFADRDQHLQALAAHLRQLDIWAENCPENFEHPAALVRAEIARIEGRDLDAMRLFEQAANSARENGFVHIEGVANELAARFYDARGFRTTAQAYLRNARYCYLRWGAEGKVRQLDRLHPQLRDERAATPSTASFGAPVEQLDIGTVVKASQALSGEILLERLIETLMTIALEHAGADRGLLILLRDDGPQIEAEAGTGQQRVEVTRRHVAVTAEELPLSILHTAIRTHQTVILDDAQQSNPFAGDEYMRQRRPRSVLCLPLMKQAELIGLLYLENNLTTGTFTPQRTTVLELLVSQAAISIENARLYSELISENRDRRKAEEALRASEASLAEGQLISHTGSWRWNAGTGEVVRWSAEHFRIFGFDPAAPPPSHSILIERVHPEDRHLLMQTLRQAVQERGPFQFDYRIVLPDGSIRHLRSLGRPSVSKPGDLEYAGTAMDITESKQAEDALRNAQAELARVARFTTMGELAASIAHEINQPLGAIVTSATASLRWLERKEPDIERARAAISRIAGDGMRAGEVVRGLKALVRKAGLELASVDVNDAIREVLALTLGERQRHSVELRAELFAGDRPVFGDRVQLQQVVLNLIMNGIEAMTAISDRPRVLTISSGPADAGGMTIAVEDTGPGVDPANADRIFEPFFTTKPNGMGMGLSICRTIIEAHGGRLWASPHAPHGTIFRLTVPAPAESSSEVRQGS